MQEFLSSCVPSLFFFLYFFLQRLSTILSVMLGARPAGPIGRASAYEAEDCGFESHAGHGRGHGRALVMGVVMGVMHCLVARFVVLFVYLFHVSCYLLWVTC